MRIEPDAGASCCSSAGLHVGDRLLNLCETADEGEIEPLEKVALTGARPLLARFRSLIARKTRAVQGNDEKDRGSKNLRQRLEEKEQRLPGLSDGDVPVFFVVGQGKSGTTWVRNVLNSHPEILCKGEGRFFERDFVRVVPPEDLEKGWLKSVQPTSLYGALSSSEHLRIWIERSVWTDGENVEEHLGNLERLAVNYFLTQRLSKTDKKIVGDKTTFSRGEVIEEIGALYPEARVIHVIRDGRDVAVSMIHHMWNYAKDAGAFYELEPEDLERRDTYRKDPKSALADGLFAERRLSSIARSWAIQVGKAVEHGPALLGNNYAEVRYEDLLQRPEEEVGRLLRFLGADAGEETVKRCVEMSSFEKWSEGRERGREDSLAFYRKGMAGDWRNVFTAEDSRVFKKAAGEVLIRLGYERDDSW